MGVYKFPTEWKFIKFHGSSHHQPAIIKGGIKDGEVPHRKRLHSRLDFPVPVLAH